MKQILRFVKEFRVVEERQILTFFADYGQIETEYAIKELKALNHIFEVNGTTRIRSELRLNNYNNYDAVIDALDVMVPTRFDNVNWYTIRDIPFELEFITGNNTAIFTVSVFDTRNWVHRYEQTKRLRHLNLPVGEKDPRTHVAVISDEALISKLEPLGFDIFVKIIDRKTGEFIKWDYID